jgi:hypothetical protein
LLRKKGKKLIPEHPFLPRPAASVISKDTPLSQEASNADLSFPLTLLSLFTSLYLMDHLLSFFIM